MNSSTTNPSRPKLLNVMIDEDGLASLEYDDQVTKWFKDQMEMVVFEVIMIMRSGWRVMLIVGKELK